MIPTRWQARSAAQTREHDVDDVGDGQRRFGLGEQRSEVPSAQVLHHQERRPVVGEPEVEDLDDVAVLDLRQRHRFAQEALAHPIGQARAGALCRWPS